MTRQEAIEKLSTIGHISVSYAEGLYDSFFPKPVVPQYVADWYEENKDYFEVSLFQCIGEVVKCYNRGSSSKFEDWLISMDVDVLTILVNMHQFGYEVEKEAKYRVMVKEITDESKTLKRDVNKTIWFFGDCAAAGISHHTRKELESNGFGWVFSCEGIEVEEVE